MIRILEMFQMHFVSCREAGENLSMQRLPCGKTPGWLYIIVVPWDPGLGLLDSLE